MLGVIPHEAAGEEQCLIMFAVFGLLFAAAYGERLWVEFFTHLFSNLVQQVCLMSYSGLTLNQYGVTFALAQRERFSKVLKHQVNRFRTICTVCGFVALS